MARLLEMASGCHRFLFFHALVLLIQSLYVRFPMWKRNFDRNFNMFSVSSIVSALLNRGRDDKSEPLSYRYCPINRAFSA
jgi:hypothetical protein